MTATGVVPDWLAQRDGTLRAGVRPETVFVVLGGQPLYRLEVRPAKGQYACAITSTANAKRLDNPAWTYPTREAALAGGLEQLRGVLGW